MLETSSLGRADPGTMLERKLEQIRREEELINEEERESAALLRADIPAPQGTTVRKALHFRTGVWSTACFVAIRRRSAAPCG